MYLKSRQDFNAAKTRALMNETNWDDEKEYILSRLKGEKNVKREEIVDSFSLHYDTDRDAAASLVAETLSELEKEGKVNHPSHGIWCAI